MAINKCGQGLAPGEREILRQSVGESEAAGFIESRALAPPLPKGEGWGEGEGTVLLDHVSRLLCLSMFSD